MKKSCSGRKINFPRVLSGQKRYLWIRNVIEGRDPFGLILTCPYAAEI